MMGSSDSERLVNVGFNEFSPSKLIPKSNLIRRLEARSLLTILAAISLCIIIYMTSYLGNFNANLRTAFHLPLNHYPKGLKRPPTHTLKSKVILLWTPFFGDWTFITDEKFEKTKSSQSNELDCSWTNDRKRLDEASAVLFHIPDLAEIFNNHNYHNKNTLDLDSLLPERRHANQSWVMLLHEAPAESYRTLLKLMDNHFNITITYRRESDIVLLPRYDKTGEKSIANLSQREFQKIASTKRKPVAWFVSNCRTVSNREDYVRRLQNAIPVDVYGKCGTLSCKPKMSENCYKKAAELYWFYLAFENNICKDYMTEKVFNALEYNWVPVVLGAGNYSTGLPSQSVINSMNFESPEILGRYLLSLIRNPSNITEYQSYLAWKSSYTRLPEEHYSCQLCRLLHQRDTSNKANSLSTYKWWFNDAKCKKWTDEGLVDAF